MSLTYILNQVYPIQLGYMYHSQQCMAKFYLKVDTANDPVEDPQDVMEHWVETQLDVIQRLVNTAVTFNYMRTWRMFMQSEGTFERIITVAGERPVVTARALPAFMTAGYRLITTNGVSNSGWIRLSGLSGADIASDNESYLAQVGSDLEAAIPDFQNMMIGTYTSDAGNVFSYVVMSQYLGALNPLSIVSVSYPKLGTQNSRKIGVGA